MHLLDGAARGALFAGLAFGLLYTVSSRVRWLGTRWLAQQTESEAYRVRTWRGWPLLYEALALLMAVAYPAFMVMRGVYSSRDVGFQPAEWSVVIPWTAGVAFLAAAWLAFLWAAYWSKRKSVGQPLADASIRLTLDGCLLRALCQEGYAAIWRAALIPLAGSYWGVWLGLVSKQLVARLNPSVAEDLASPARREMILLDWALDWIAGALFVVTSSVVAAVIVRLVGYVAVQAVLRVFEERAGALAEEERP